VGFKPVAYRVASGRIILSFSSNIGRGEGGRKRKGDPKLTGKNLKSSQHEESLKVEKVKISGRAKLKTIIVFF